MKGKTVIILVAVLLVLGIAVAAIIHNKPDFTGNRVANPDSYMLSIEHMNGTDTHTMELSAGSVLQVNFETVSGSVNMEIKAQDGTLLYAGNGSSATDFTLNIFESGTYTVTVEARHAKGMVNIQLKED